MEVPLVLVFGPAATDAAVMQQRAWLEQQVSRIAERDLTVSYIFEHGPSIIGDDAILSEDVTTLRQRFAVPVGTFKFVLVGKDGGVKHATNEPVSADDLFAQIDAMPMRQREMRQQGGNR